MNVNVLLNRPCIHGWELRQGIVPFAEMVTKAMKMRPIHDRSGQHRRDQWQRCAVLG